MDGAEKERVARRIVDRLRARGFTAFFAGGYVRDRLLGAPVQDIDIATDAPAAEVQRLFARTVPVGAQFGVVLVIEDGQPFEVATFRADEAYADGRRPESVRFTSPEEDAQRRDFTINGMFYDPATERIVDYVGGEADVRRGLIRAIGDPVARFREDRLRMLRAVRLAARLRFAIDGATLDAVRQEAHTITDIAWERIGDEIVRILTEGDARRGFELLDASTLLGYVLPEVAALKGVEQSPDYHPEGDVFTHTLLLLAGLRQPTETLALGALLHDVAKPGTAARTADRITFYGHCTEGAVMAVAVCQRLRRSRATWERVDYLVRNHLRLRNARDMRLSTLKRFLTEDGIDELLELARLDALASNRDLTDYEFCRQKRAELRAAPRLPPPLVRGGDLLALGYRPGPIFATILNAVQDAQLEGLLDNRADALTWIRDRFKPEGPEGSGPATGDS
jgi:poly(A) polymerase